MVKAVGWYKDFGYKSDEQKKPNKFSRFWKLPGPGLITGASHDSRKIELPNHSWGLMVGYGGTKGEPVQYRKSQNKTVKPQTLSKQSYNFKENIIR